MSPASGTGSERAKVASVAERKPPASTWLREVHTNPSPGSLAQVEEHFRGGVLLPESMGDPLAGHPAPERVESRPQSGIPPKGLQDAEPGELPHVRKRRPRQCDRGGPGYGRRHVRHAVMDDSLLDVERVRMRRRAGRLQGAPLVD